MLRTDGNVVEWGDVSGGEGGEDEGRMAIGDTLRHTSTDQ